MLYHVLPGTCDTVNHHHIHRFIQGTKAEYQRRAIKKDSVVYSG